MKKQPSAFQIIFTVIMALCVLFVVWYLPSLGQRQFQIQDVQLSLETSQGRERKQQHEYDETVAAIPDVQAELDRLLPLAEEAKEEVKTLKAERKDLREQIKELQKQTDESKEMGQP